MDTFLLPPWLAPSKTPGTGKEESHRGEELVFSSSQGPFYASIWRNDRGHVAVPSTFLFQKKAAEQEKTEL